MKAFRSSKKDLAGRFYFSRNVWFKILNAELIFIRLSWDLDGIRWGEGYEYKILAKRKATALEVKKLMGCDRWTFAEKYGSC